MDLLISDHANANESSRSMEPNQSGTICALFYHGEKDSTEYELQRLSDMMSDPEFVFRKSHAQASGPSNWMGIVGSDGTVPMDASATTESDDDSDTDHDESVTPGATARPAPQQQVHEAPTEIDRLKKENKKMQKALTFAKSTKKKAMLEKKTLQGTVGKLRTDLKKTKGELESSQAAMKDAQATTDQIQGRYLERLNQCINRLDVDIGPHARAGGGKQVIRPQRPSRSASRSTRSHAQSQQEVSHVKRKYRDIDSALENLEQEVNKSAKRQKVTSQSQHTVANLKEAMKTLKAEKKYLGAQLERHMKILTETQTALDDAQSELDDARSTLATHASANSASSSASGLASTPSGLPSNKEETASNVGAPVTVPEQLNLGAINLDMQVKLREKEAHCLELSRNVCYWKAKAGQLYTEVLQSRALVQQSNERVQQLQNQVIQKSLASQSFFERAIETQLQSHVHAQNMRGSGLMLAPPQNQQSLWQSGFGMGGGPGSFLQPVVAHNQYGGAGPSFAAPMQHAQIGGQGWGSSRPVPPHASSASQLPTSAPQLNPLQAANLNTFTPMSDEQLQAIAAEFNPSAQGQP